MSATTQVGSIEMRRIGAVAVLKLNEPKSMNAFSAGIKDGLETLVPAVTSDPDIRAVVITGEGRAFCAGGDIRNMDDRRTTAVHARMRRHQKWLMPLLNAPKPVVTAINGAAAGAGLSLALTGDIIIAGRAARFKAGFPGLGAAPDLGLAYTLPRVVGMLKAKELLLTNRELNAEEAQAFGLVTRVVEDAALMDQAIETATLVAQGPTTSLGLTKNLLQRAYELPLEAFLEAEAGAQVVAFGSEDFAEGVAAFKGKRKPAFPGR